MSRPDHRTASAHPPGAAPWTPPETVAPTPDAPDAQAAGLAARAPAQRTGTAATPVRIFPEGL
ncbi:hypothetical protein [Streptomyces sp. CB01881]|uniref:hypothetical protein n=1 Tax=Streptomyces sp. CB01881 TaxID=2078691 RepID=UPI000CDC856B|nr:hypothetical protein [Streptomyces sp. CB01881]AUY53463.1 hypothetical protein C2142_36420 [Streptomyces sp. CB01881]TYC69612.1 hypothetical protein EH183_36460 [Streptomyces sp. CB01881]